MFERKLVAYSLNPVVALRSNAPGSKPFSPSDGRRPGTCARGVIAELRARERGGLIGPGSPFLIGVALATGFRRLSITTD
jgi:hypothetical protein